jgi:hypothetical protein
VFIIHLELIGNSVTDSMEQSSSSETGNLSATQEFTKILRNPKARYHFHNSSPLDRVVSQMNPVHTTPSWFSAVHLSIFLRLAVPSGVFPSACFHQEPICIPLLPVRATCPVHIFLLYLAKSRCYEGTHYAFFTIPSPFR